MNILPLLKQLALFLAIALIPVIGVCTAQTIQTTGDVNQPYPGTGTPWTIDGSAINGADGFRIGDGEMGTTGVGSLLISGGAQVINNDAFGAGSIAGYGLIGYWLDSDGTATVTGAGSQWDNEFSLTVGVFGAGTLEIFDGGVVSSTGGGVGVNQDIAGFASPTGLATINGAGSQWNMTAHPDPNAFQDGNLTVGFFNDGTMNVEAGGAVNNVNGFVGRDAGGAGVVNVSGSNSQWNNSGNLHIGGDSTITPTSLGDSGELNINAGAAVTVGGTMTVYEPGTVNLSGGTLDVATLDLSAATATDDFNMTGGRLVVDSIDGSFQQDGGTLAPGDSPGLTNIENNYDMLGGMIEFEIAGTARGTEYDTIDVGLDTGMGIAGQANLFGVMDVNLIDGFMAMEGDSFQLVYAGTGTGSIFGTPTFDFSDAVLESGLEWDTGTFLSNGTISVSAAVPEPTSLTLVGLALCSLALRRRRSC